MTCCRMTSFVWRTSMPPGQFPLFGKEGQKIPKTQETAEFYRICFQVVKQRKILDAEDWNKHVVRLCSILLLKVGFELRLVRSWPVSDSLDSTRLHHVRFSDELHEETTVFFGKSTQVSLCFLGRVHGRLAGGLLEQDPRSLPIGEKWRLSFGFEQHVPPAQVSFPSCWSISLPSTRYRS